MTRNRPVGCLKRATEVDPKQAAYWGGWVDLELNRGEIQRALQLARTGLEITKEKGLVHLKTVILERLKNQEASDQSAKTAYQSKKQAETTGSKINESVGLLKQEKLHGGISEFQAYLSAKNLVSHSEPDHLFLGLTLMAPYLSREVLREKKQGFLARRPVIPPGPAKKGSNQGPKLYTVFCRYGRGIPISM